MNKRYDIEKSIEIACSTSELWEALTTPSMVKQYLMGAHVYSNWEEGSEIVYSGNFNGMEFKDVGKIKLLKKEEQFKYSYWSANHGTENTPENQVSILYTLEGDSLQSKLTMNQSNYQSEEIAKGMDHIWDLILNNLKSYLEKD